MPRVVVFGGSGKAGEYISCELLSKGYEVLVADRVSPAEQSRTYGPASGSAKPYRARGVEFKQVDVTDLGQVVSVTADADAIVHMAAYPSPDPVTEDIVFRTNVMNNWNILEAAEMHGIKKVVMASSINALGASFGDHQPVDYFPLDEDHRTRAQDAYAQSKWIGEQMGDAFARRRPGAVQIASFRFHLLVGPTEFGMAFMGPSHWLSDPDGAEAASEKEFFGWTGKHDMARAVRMALEAEWDGHEVFFISNKDSRCLRPTREVLERWYPGTPIAESLGTHDSPISVAKAERILGWVPVETWRNGVEGLKEPEPCDGARPARKLVWARRAKL